jgi:hypothetical protein
MGSMRCNVEFGYQLRICSGTKENLYRVGRSQDLTDANCLLASSPAQVKVTLRPTISQPIRLGVRRPSGTRDQFFFLLEIFF